MKFIVPSLIAMLMSLACTAQNAQQKGDSTSQAPYENKDDILFRKLDNPVPVPVADVPPQLRTTFNQDQYRGWEKGKVFRIDEGKIYELQLKKGKKTKIYRFDAEGRTIRE